MEKRNATTEHSVIIGFWSSLLLNLCYNETSRVGTDSVGMKAYFSRKKNKEFFNVNVIHALKWVADVYNFYENDS